jgi:betaine-aldehyde dehydrogenase
VWKWAPTLTAGNTMVLKPSDTTPASTVWIDELMAELLPDGVVNVVCGAAPRAALVRHPIPQMVSTTGSVAPLARGLHADQARDEPDRRVAGARA